MSLELLLTNNFNSLITDTQKSQAQKNISLLLQDEKYAPYLKIADKVPHFLDYFQMDYDKQGVKTSLSLYFLWLKCIDEELDTGDEHIGEQVKQNLLNSQPNITEEIIASTPLLLSEVLKVQTTPATYHHLLENLHELYDSTLSEKTAPSMSQYIYQRKKSGILTAQGAFIMMEPHLLTHNHKFVSFFQQLGALGNIVDSVVDLRNDIHSQTYSFHVTFLDVVQLYTQTSKDAIKVILQHPRLVKQFSKSAVNVLKNSFL